MSGGRKRKAEAREKEKEQEQRENQPAGSLVVKSHLKLSSQFALPCGVTLLTCYSQSGWICEVVPDWCVC